jgi:hypothetical protein
LSKIGQADPVLHEYVLLHDQSTTTTTTTPTTTTTTTTEETRNVIYAVDEGTHFEPEVKSCKKSLIAVTHMSFTPTEPQSKCLILFSEEVNVMIANSSDFCRFLTKNVAFFLI